MVKTPGSSESPTDGCDTTACRGPVWLMLSRIGSDLISERDEQIYGSRLTIEEYHAVLLGKLLLAMSLVKH